MSRGIVVGLFAGGLSFVAVLGQCSRMPGAEITSAWSSAADGNWVDAANWSTADYPNNGTPTATDEYAVEITAAGTPYTVILDNAVEVNSLTIDSAEATLHLRQGKLTVDTIDLANGTLFLGGDIFNQATDPEIVGATITGGGTLTLTTERRTTPIFNDVTVGVDFTVPSAGGSPKHPTLMVRNGLTLMNDARVSLFDRSTLMVVDGTQTIDGAGQFVFEDTSTSVRTGEIRLTNDTTLTVGSGIAIRARTMGGLIGSTVSSQFVSNLGLINEGLISGEVNDWRLTIMDVPLSTGSFFENRGTVQVTRDSEVIVGSNWTNLGTFVIRDNGRLTLSGEYRLNDIGTIDRIGGELVISGTVLNNNKTFYASATTGDLTFGAGDFRGGVIDAKDGAQWIFEGGVMTDVTVATDLNIGTTSGGRGLDVHGDLTLDQATFSLASNDCAQCGSSIEFIDTGTAQELNGTGEIRFVAGRINRITGSGSLTIGAGVALSVENSTGALTGSNVVTENMITVGAGSQLAMEPGDLTIRGEVEVTGNLTIGRDDNSTWRNEGTVRIKPGGRLFLRGIFTVDDLGTVIDEGADYVRLHGVLDNTGRTLDLEDLNLTVPFELHSGEIRGGTLLSSGGASLYFININTLDSVTLASDLTFGGASPQIFAPNGITLDNVTLSLEKGVRFGVGGMLDGEGTITVPAMPTSGSSNSLGSDDLVIGENITIRNGTGTYVNLAIGFKENYGTIIAEAPNSLLSIGENRDTSTWRNLGVIQVHDGTLQFLGSYSTSDIGTVEQYGGEVYLRGKIQNQGQALSFGASRSGWKVRATIYGGRVETSDGVVLDIGAEYHDVTLAGDFILYDDFSSTAPGYSSIYGTLNLDGGSLTMERDTELAISNYSSIAGNGEILLNGTPQTTKIQTYNGSQLTIGAGVTVRTGPTGGGTISRSSLPVINYGTVSAETAGQRLVVDGSFQNLGTLQVLNGSELTISSASFTNQGTMVVGDGEFLINSFLFDNGVNGTIRGSGELNLLYAVLVNKGTIAPGSSPGNLVIGNSLIMEMTSMLDLEFAGTGQGEFDTIHVTGDVTLAGGLSVSQINGFEFELNQQFAVLTVDGSRSGQFAGLGEGARVFTKPGVGLFLTYQAGDGNDVGFYTAVPEPSAWVLLALGLIGLVGCARGRRRK